MKITDIEVIPLRVPYEARIRKQFYHFGMTEHLTIYKFHTDTGLVGLGENPGPPFAQDQLDAYLGTCPFDHVMSTGVFNLDMACYDLMGKHLGVPAWKVMGQQVRQWVSMGWWMPCMSPEASAAEVEEAAGRGYRGLKCKARAFYDVVEQAQAMQEVAPSDFRIEFDFNGALIDVEKALPILRALEKILIFSGETSASSKILLDPRMATYASMRFIRSSSQDANSSNCAPSPLVISSLFTVASCNWTKGKPSRSRTARTIATTISEGVL